MILKTLFSNIAAAIRRKLGTTETIKPSNFASIIDSLRILPNGYDVEVNVAAIPDDFATGDYLGVLCVMKIKCSINFDAVITLPIVFDNGAFLPSYIKYNPAPSAGTNLPNIFPIVASYNEEGIRVLDKEKNNVEILRIDLLAYTNLEV